jgi:peptidoglycan hydrolase-like protein with peptidoglycan-binding domain
MKHAAGRALIPGVAVAFLVGSQFGAALAAASPVSKGTSRHPAPSVTNPATGHVGLYRKHSTSKKATTRKTIAGRRGKGRKAKPGRSTAYTRLARMQMDPARVQSIQRALMSAGAFHGAPTGRWDSETRDAMARYQAANGFGVTGLPDAKSLMKLGLGPHPLPAELSKTPAAAAGGEPDPAPGSATLPPPEKQATQPPAPSAAPAQDPPDSTNSLRVPPSAKRR